MNNPVGGDSNVTSCRLTYTSTIPMTSAGGSLTCWIKFLKLPVGGDRCTPFFSHLSYVNLYGTNILQTGGYGSGTYNSFTPVVDTWYHYAQVWNGTVMVVYINGAVLGTSAEGSISTPVNAYVNITAETVRPTSADYDDLRIYNTALTAAQVQSVYSSQGAPAPSRAMPLPKLAWDFNGTTAPYIGSATGTTTGTVSYTPGKFNQAIAFPNASGTGSNNVSYSITSMPVDSGITVSLWVKFNQLQDSYFFLMAGASYITFKTAGTSMNWFMVNNGLYPGGFLANYAVNTWYHLVLSIGNMSVGAYFNGALQATTAYTTPGTTVSNPRIGAEYGVGINGLIDDLRIFDRALTAAQVQSIYNQQGVPGRGASGLSLPLDKVSGQVSGAYSTRLIRTGYTGPVVRVRRNSDSTQLDFISDVTGNLSNVSSAVTIGSWLSSTTGNVSTWYDQSGGSNNFTQSITSQQPQIVQNGGKWVVWFNRDATPTFYSNLSCATTMTGIKTIVYNFNTIYNSYQTILGSEQADNTGFRFNSNKIIGDASSGRLGSDFLAAAGSYWYLNGAYGYMISNDGTTGVPSGNYIYNDLAWNHVVGVQNGGGMDGFGFNSISSPQLSIKIRAMNGYMSEIILFRNQLSAADSLYLYDSRYISRGSQITLTGAYGT